MLTVEAAVPATLELSASCVVVFLSSESFEVLSTRTSGAAVVTAGPARR